MHFNILTWFNAFYPEASDWAPQRLHSGRGQARLCSPMLSSAGGKSSKSPKLKRWMNGTTWMWIAVTNMDLPRNKVEISRLIKGFSCHGMRWVVLFPHLLPCTSKSVELQLFCAIQVLKFLGCLAYFNRQQLQVCLSSDCQALWPLQRLIQ